MDFRPEIATHLKEMDPRLYRPKPMNLKLGEGVAL
jgi:acyl CoA:acetate/3-ketoacid CoA transferase